MPEIMEFDDFESLMGENELEDIFISQIRDSVRAAKKYHFSESKTFLIQIPIRKLKKKFLFQLLDGVENIEKKKFIEIEVPKHHITNFQKRDLKEAFLDSSYADLLNTQKFRLKKIKETPIIKII